MFNILEFKNRLKLVDEKNTEYTFKCPVCKKNYLKVNKNSGKFACYSQYECKYFSIISSLGYKPKDNNELLKYREKQTFENYESKEWSTIDFIFLENYELSKSIKSHNKIKTIYQYNEHSVVERIDYLKDGKWKKKCFPKYKLKDKWTYGSNLNFGLYNQKYLPNKKSTILLVEGEKCADLVSKYYKILAMTSPVFGWNENYLFSFFLINRLKVNGVIYIPDNDEVGEKKSEVVENACKKAIIPFYKFNLSKFVDLDKGEDIGDIILKDTANVKEKLLKIKL